jgi:very-short-patch-repair endonuclease
VRAADKRCASIAEEQFGLVEREQALKSGMSLAAVSRRLVSGRWLKVLPRVYRLAGVPKSWQQSLKAVTLWGDSRCVVSHETAAALHGLNVSGGRIHVQSPKQLQRSNVAAHRTRFAPLHAMTVKGIATTSVTRTLVDLSGSLPKSSLEKLLDEAIRRSMTDAARLRAELRRCGSRRGTRLLRRLLASRDGSSEKTDSELEDKLLRVIRRARLPAPVVHYNVVHGDEWLGEVDFAYPEAQIAIEAHGYRVHSLKRVWENDQRRENGLVRAGWKLLKATHLQLDQQPRSFVEALRSLLAAAKTNNLRRRTRLSKADLSRDDSVADHHRFHPFGIETAAAGIYQTARE